MKSPNLDLKQGIGPKAGNFLSGKREWEGAEGEREIDGRNIKIEERDRGARQRDRATKRQS